MSAAAALATAMLPAIMPDSRRVADHDPELSREDPEEIRERVARQGDGQDTSAAQAIRKSAPDRREHELQQGVEGAEQAAEEHRLLEDGISAHPLGGRVQRTDQGSGRAFRPDIMVQEMGEQRNDDAEAHDIHEHRQEDKSEDAALGEDGGDGHAPHDGVLPPAQTKQRLAEAPAGREDEPMRFLALLALLVNLGGISVRAATNPKLLLIEQKLSGFEDRDYAAAVEKTLGEFEGRTGLSLRPGELEALRPEAFLRRRPGTGHAQAPRPGPDRSPPAPRLRPRRDHAVRRQARQPPPSRLPAFALLPARRFRRIPVLAWETLAPGWAADSRLRYENQVLPRPGTQNVPWGDARVSVLPKTLIDEVDFWINLPVLSDSRSLGVHGAMAAASIGNMANAERFLDNPFNASKAAVEVCAIPKLAKRNVLTILSLERYQVLGGPGFDASWCRSEKTLLGSANPVIIDFIGLQKINAGRAASGIATIHPEPPIFAAANAGEIRLGSCRPADITLVRLPAP
jgi:hypothetical protein